MGILHRFMVDFYIIQRMSKKLHIFVKIITIQFKMVESTINVLDNKIKNNLGVSIW